VRQIYAYTVYIQYVVTQVSRLADACMHACIKLCKLCTFMMYTYYAIMAKVVAIRHCM